MPWLELDRRWSRSQFEIDPELAVVRSEIGPSVDDIQPTLELLERAPALYMKQVDHGRARVLKTLLWNCRIRGENLDPVYRSPSTSWPKGSVLPTGTPNTTRPLADASYVQSPKLHSSLRVPKLQSGPAGKLPINVVFLLWYPLVDDFGTLAWPSRAEIESLLIVS